MQTVLLHHSTAAASVLAWRGIIAAATVFAVYASSRASHSLGTHGSQSAGKQSSRSPSDPAEGPSSAADGPTVMTPGFLTALPGVMACYSCHAEPAALSPSTRWTKESNEAVHVPHQHLQPVFKLLKADERLMRPYIAALAVQGQQSVKQVVLSSQAQPSSLSLCDEAERDGGGRPAEYAREADGLDVPVAKPAVGGGGETAVAAVDALLALCEEQALLAQVLRLLQPLSEACNTLRCALSQMLLHSSSDVGQEYVDLLYSHAAARCVALFRVQQPGLKHHVYAFLVARVDRKCGLQD